MESTDTSDFIYTISVQGHGAYPTQDVLKDPHIKVTLKEDDEARQNQLTYYANQIYEMDLFVAELTRQLKDFNEPCILVMYGDHLPSLGIEETDMNQEISSQQNIFCGVISRWKSRIKTSRHTNLVHM